METRLQWMHGSKGAADGNIVVEGKHYVETGTICFMEGDIIEAECASTGNYAPGEQVKINIYSKDGLTTHYTTIIAKHRSKLFLLNPPELQSKALLKRRNVRIASDFTAILSRSEDGGRVDPQQEVRCNIHDISLGGIGLSVGESAKLSEQTMYAVQIESGFEFAGLIRIVYTQASDAGLKYGAEFVNLSRPMQFKLRSFILLQQVQSRI